MEELRRTHGWNIGTQNKLSSYEAGGGLGSAKFGRTMRFTWDGEARVELVVKSPDKDWNKAAFDLLMESRTRLVEELGQLNWERLDDYKMSRVVVSRPGSIDNSEEELDEIRTWMIEHVTRFRTTFGPYLEAVLASMQENSQRT